MLLVVETQLAQNSQRSPPSVPPQLCRNNNFVKLSALALRSNNNSRCPGECHTIDECHTRGARVSTQRSQPAQETLNLKPSISNPRNFGTHNVNINEPIQTGGNQETYQSQTLHQLLHT
jgi:hypothetical protein